MRFMNDYDIDMAERRHADHPVIQAAVRTMRALMAAADANSDGWAHWPKPARAASKLMELIEGDGTNEAIRKVDERATREAYAVAVRPIKAFRTRSGIDFEVAEVAA